jgi:hypothetical protein
MPIHYVVAKEHADLFVFQKLLNFQHLSSGSIFRDEGLSALRTDQDPDGEAVVQILHLYLPRLKWDFAFGTFPFS